MLICTTLHSYRQRETTSKTFKQQQKNGVGKTSCLIFASYKTRHQNRGFELIYEMVQKS